jgi:hypothetical protein
MTTGWRPSLRVSDVAGRCRLSLDGLSYGTGPTLQEAADDLVARLLTLAAGLRSGDFRVPAELGPPDPRLLGFLWEIGERAARGEDVRRRVLGPVAT